MPSKLARNVPLEILGRALNIKTPLLVPSFSSKALADIGPVFEALKLDITESFLVSAYDISYGNLKLPSEALAEVLFLDSGGYEVSKDYDVMDPQYPSAEPKKWCQKDFQKVLQEIDTVMPTFVTAFDHPNERQSISQQINNAVETFKCFPDMGREILFKPETVNAPLVPIDSLIYHVRKFSEFDIVGITETELGSSVLDRMVSIARLRRAMDENNVKKPLHVYRSLDPVCTPLYFLAGADIFDGLSWIRFSYWKDMAVHHKNRSLLEFGPYERDERALIRCCAQNLYFLTNLKRRLDRYLLDRDEDVIGGEIMDHLCGSIVNKRRLKTGPLASFHSVKRSTMASVKDVQGGDVRASADGPAWWSA